MTKLVPSLQFAAARWVSLSLSWQFDICIMSLGATASGLADMIGPGTLCSLFADGVTKLPLVDQSQVHCRFASLFSVHTTLWRISSTRYVLPFSTEFSSCPRSPKLLSTKPPIHYQTCRPLSYFASKSKSFSTDTIVSYRHNGRPQLAEQNSSSSVQANCWPKQT